MFPVPGLFPDTLLYCCSRLRKDRAVSFLWIDFEQISFPAAGHCRGGAQSLNQEGARQRTVQGGGALYGGVALNREGVQGGGAESLLLCQHKSSLLTAAVKM